MRFEGYVGMCVRTCLKEIRVIQIFVLTSSRPWFSSRHKSQEIKTVKLIQWVWMLTIQSRKLIAVKENTLQWNTTCETLETLDRDTVPRITVLLAPLLSPPRVSRLGRGLGSIILSNVISICCLGLVISPQPRPRWRRSLRKIQELTSWYFQSTESQSSPPGCW